MLLGITQEFRFLMTFLAGCLRAICIVLFEQLIEEYGEAMICDIAKV